MTPGQPSPDPTSTPPDGELLTALPVTPDRRREAVARLLSHDNRASEDIARRFISQAPGLGIDLDLLAATCYPEGHPRAGTISQVCLPVPGAGRTVMLFVSGGSSDPASTAQRAAAVLRAVSLAAERRGVHLAQALTEPHEHWAEQAYQAAGLRRIADLLYLSRPLRLGEGRRDLLTTDEVAPPDASPWPEGICVRPTADTPDDLAALRRALEASYADTLDCPELAGMRTLDDIVAAHRAVGEFDPRLWWLAERDGVAEGCVLLNRCADQACVELVYIGLSPAVRGLGLARRLMQAAIAVAATLERELRCAVDTRNTPALRLYQHLGFREAGRRTAFVGLVKDLPQRKS